MIVTHELRTVHKRNSRASDAVSAFAVKARDEKQILYDGPPTGLVTSEDARVRRFVEGEARDRL